MKLREYEYMLAIAQEANMTRAAQRLYISQPALSKLLASVESELGVQLFRQENRRMIPTAAGKIYLENAEKILSLNHDMERTVRLASSQSELTLAYPLIYSGFITGSVLPAMCRINPSVSVHILHSAQSKILDHILHGHFPFAVGIVTDSIRQSASFINIGQQEMVLAVHKGHPLETQAVLRADCTYPYIPAEALSNFPFLVPSPTSFSGHFAVNYFYQHQLHPSIVLSSPLTGPLYQSVSMDCGIALLPSIPLRHMQLADSIAYLSVEPCVHPYTVGLIFRKDRILSDYEIALSEQMAALF